MNFNRLLPKLNRFISNYINFIPNNVCYDSELHLELHNITHSLIYQNPREWTFIVQISLLIVTFLSLISLILSLMQTIKEVNPQPRIAPCVNMWSVTFLIFFFFFLCHVLNIGAHICHMAQEGQVEWTTPTEVRGE